MRTAPLGGGRGGGEEGEEGRVFFSKALQSDSRGSNLDYYTITWIFLLMDINALRQLFAEAILVDFVVDVVIQTLLASAKSCDFLESVSLSFYIYHVVFILHPSSSLSLSLPPSTTTTSSFSNSTMACKSLAARWQKKIIA